MSNQNPTHGQKVTDTSAAKIDESAGAVASDSLAAESDTFPSNRNGEPLGVSGSSSTFANTNISGAETLPAAVNSEARDGPNDKPYKQSKVDAVVETAGSYETGGSTSNAETAPSYVNNQYVRDNGGPHGKNLKEGGFETEGVENASFGTDIGGENDPGRLAEEKFQKISANNVGMTGSQTKDGTTSDTQYESLERDESA